MAPKRLDFRDSFFLSVSSPVWISEAKKLASMILSETLVYLDGHSWSLWPLLFQSFVGGDRRPTTIDAPWATAVSPGKPARRGRGTAALPVLCVLHPRPGGVEELFGEKIIAPLLHP